MMPSREEEVQEKKALEFFDAISKDREFTALYNSILGKPCPTTKDLKNLEGDPRASKRIISYANFVQIGLKTEWKNLPPEMKEGYRDIDENRPFDTLEIGKKVLQAVHTANLFILVLRVGMAAPDAWGERVDLPPFEDSVKWLEKLLEIAAQLLPTLKLPPELVLDCDGMTHLPTEIKDLKGVSHLTIKRASFPTLPDQIGELKTLTELDLSDNKFTSLPSTIGQLEALETLNSSGNQLTTVPSTIGQLKALKQVDLSNNKIDRLPSTFWQLKALETLYLNNNQLTTLPQECRGLNALSELSLLHNPLTSLPQEALQELTPHLKILSVDGDKMMLIPAAHDDAVRNASIFDYLRGRLHEVVQPLRDMLGV
jgi:Leucine-rich repeat (LRR) protein